MTAARDAVRGSSFSAIRTSGKHDDAKPSDGALLVSQSEPSSPAQRANVSSTRLGSGREAAAGPAPTVTVIVPAWNAEHTIGRCLDSLTRQTFPAEQTQIIVVDNGSTDGTAAIALGYEGVILLTEPVASSYRARNLGLAHATGDFVAFTDADCEPAPEWIEKGVHALQQGAGTGIAAGEVRMTPVLSEQFSGAAHLYEVLFAFKQKEAASLGHCFTANWMSPRWVFEQVGVFDATLKSGGDLDLSNRISKRSLDVRYVADMIVYHPTRSTIAELVSKRRRVTGGQWGREVGRTKLPRILLFTSVEAARRSLKALRATEHPLLDRFKLVALLLGLGMVGIIELFRLALGGEARRA